MAATKDESEITFAEILAEAEQQRQEDEARASQASYRCHKCRAQFVSAEPLVLGLCRACRRQ